MNSQPGAQGAVVRLIILLAFIVVLTLLIYDTIQIRANTNQIREITTKISGFRSQAPTPTPIPAIYFNATQSSLTVTPPQSRTWIPDSLFTNDGNGLTANVGTFTAPYTGVYLFTAQALAPIIAGGWLDFVLEIPQMASIIINEHVAVGAGAFFDVVGTSSAFMSSGESITFAVSAPNSNSSSVTVQSLNIQGKFIS